eukprot:TRINITY_DN6168_c0_g3_i10.p1 TRINITY_DN6168_c0_g3~~TRINITY_DN6168_c0_g3_i10.p1  ORF type:complete len:728 (+),score=75.50 TRINITY_DN6168_c0_g3_i10:1-2184(+)
MLYTTELNSNLVSSVVDTLNPKEPGFTNQLVAVTRTIRDIANGFDKKVLKSCDDTETCNGNGFCQFNTTNQISICICYAYWGGDYCDKPSETAALAQTTLVILKKLSTIPLLLESADDYAMGLRKVAATVRLAPSVDNINATWNDLERIVYLSSSLTNLPQSTLDRVVQILTDLDKACEAYLNTTFTMVKNGTDQVDVDQLTHNITFFKDKVKNRTLDILLALGVERTIDSPLVLRSADVVSMVFSVSGSIGATTRNLSLSIGNSRQRRRFMRLLAEDIPDEEDDDEDDYPDLTEFEDEEEIIPSNINVPTSAIFKLTKGDDATLLLKQYYSNIYVNVDRRPEYRVATAIVSLNIRSLVNSDFYKRDETVDPIAVELTLVRDASKTFGSSNGVQAESEGAPAGIQTASQVAAPPSTFECLMWDDSAQKWEAAGCKYNGFTNGRVMCTCDRISDYAARQLIEGVTNRQTKNTVVVSDSGGEESWLVSFVLVAIFMVLSVLTLSPVAEPSQTASIRSLQPFYSIIFIADPANPKYVRLMLLVYTIGVQAVVNALYLTSLNMGKEASYIQAIPAAILSLVVSFPLNYIMGVIKLIVLPPRMSDNTKRLARACSFCLIIFIVDQALIGLTIFLNHELPISGGYVWLIGFAGCWGMDTALDYLMMVLALRVPALVSLLKYRGFYMDTTFNQVKRRGTRQATRSRNLQDNDPLSPMSVISSPEARIQGNIQNQ